MTLSVLTVTAFPDTLGHGRVSPNPERIVLQVVRGGSADTVTVQPLSIDTVPVSFANQFGARVERTGLTAAFDLRALPAPPFDIIVVNPLKEAHDHVKPKDLSKLR